MAYLPLSTANLPDPAIDPAQDVEPRDYFETFLYTGNGAGLQVGDVIKKPADTTDITNSLIFDGSTSYLSHTTSGTSSGQDQITVSFWIKNWKPDTSTFNHIWSALQGGSDLCFYMALTTTHAIRFYFDETPSGSVGPTYFDTPILFTDTSRWYHVHLKVDLNQSTTADKYKVWIDGVQQTFSYTVQGGVQETNVDLFQNGTTHNIGRYIGNSSQHLGMYLAELHAVDGTAHDPTDFGNFDANGIWIPKTVTAVSDYGTNGFYLDFSDNTSTTTLGEDQTANGNDWTLNGFTDTSNQVSDSPTDNFATLDPNNKNSAVTLSEGNLSFTASNNRFVTSTIAVNSGKWYLEFSPTAGGGSGVGVGIILATTDVSGGAGFANSGTYTGVGYTTNGNKYISSVASAYGDGYGAGNVIGIALDLDSTPQTITFYKDDANQGSINLPTSNQTWLFATDFSHAGTHSINFGQKTFAKTQPTGFLALSENNITVDDQNLESPDLVWIKNRDGGTGHVVFDSVRGVGPDKELSTNNTTDEGGVDTSTYGYVSSLNTNGFTVTQGSSSSATLINGAGVDYVAWCWKAPTSFSNGAGENEATIASSGKVSTESGFSIVSFNSGAAGEQSFKHGLSQVPEIVFLKSRTTNQAWPVWTSLTGNPQTAYGYLNYPNAFNTDALQWKTAPTSTLFTFNSNYALNSNADCIAYCFHSVDGYSKLGSYTGNGGGGGTSGFDGPFVYTGFRPSFVLVKNASAGWNWIIWDAKRDTYNQVNGALQPNTGGDEYDVGGYMSVDFLSNGFKIRSNDSQENGSGNTHIYMAFAENPFKYSNAR